MAKAKVAETSKSKFPHVENLDIHDDGILHEVAIVKRWEDGSYSYIDIQQLGQIDTGRLRTILTGQHADKYQLHELLAQSKLSNGMNALDFFHSNHVKIKRGVNAVSTNYGGGLKNAKFVETGVMVGSDFSDTGSAVPTDIGVNNIK